MVAAIYSLQLLCIFHLKFLPHLVPGDFSYIESQYCDLVHDTWSQSPTVGEGFDYPDVTCAAASGHIHKER